MVLRLPPVSILVLFKTLKKLFLGCVLFKILICKVSLSRSICISLFYVTKCFTEGSDTEDTVKGAIGPRKQRGKFYLIVKLLLDVTVEFCLNVKSAC